MGGKVRFPRVFPFKSLHSQVFFTIQVHFRVLFVFCGNPFIQDPFWAKRGLGRYSSLRCEAAVTVAAWMKQSENLLQRCLVSKRVVFFSVTQTHSKIPKRDTVVDEALESSEQAGGMTVFREALS